MKILNMLRRKKIISLIFLIIITTICLALFYSSNKKKYKILIIGLDGAGWNVMRPLIEEGKLPNIKRLMDNGCWGKLRILMEPVSEVIWTTIATGKRPSIHGIDGQAVHDPDTNEMVPPTSNLRKVKALWNIISERKKKVGVVGYRVSWPAEKVNGVMISDRAYDGNYFSQRYSEPPFVNLCTENIFNSLRIGRSSPVMLMDENRIFNSDIFMANSAKYLLKNKKYDFFCLYLFGIDVYSHYYWGHMFPVGQEISEEEILKYKDVISNYYIWCDAVIGDLLKIIDKNTIIIVVSDHGFRTNYLQGRQYFFSKVDSLLEAVGLRRFRYNSKEIMLQNTQEMVWIDTKSIKIIGDLSPKGFNVVREKAKRLLRNIRFKETGEAIFSILGDTNSGFLFKSNSKRINQGPMCHFWANDQEYKIADFLTIDSQSGTHDKNGAIIIISGKDIRRNQQIMSATLYDIAPTALYLLNLPIATDMPGKILAEAMDLDILNKKHVRYIDTYEKYKKPSSQKPIRSPVDEEIIKKRARSLGYIN